jgi:hypothetical protein
LFPLGAGAAVGKARTLRQGSAKRLILLPMSRFAKRQRSMRALRSRLIAGNARTALGWCHPSMAFTAAAPLHLPLLLSECWGRYWNMDGTKLGSIGYDDEDERVDGSELQLLSGD